jgi:PIN domain-containing protein
MASVYLETTIISYLSARPSRDVVTAAHQQITREWWERRNRFDLFVSELVVQEAGAGDAGASVRRLELLQGIPVLSLTRDALELARDLVNIGPLPEKALADALHISISVFSGMDFLVTWNCRHLANAVLRYRIEQICRTKGYNPPIICTPEELMEA